MSAVKRRFPPLPTIRDVLRMYQITAKKNMSQNFILDPSILKRIAKAAGDLTGKYVIEVGPGPGGITRACLAANAKQVLVIEKDPRFIPSLKLLQEAAGGPERLRINIGDCLYYNVENLIPDTVCQPWDTPTLPDVHLVGNLPFNVATPFLIRLLNSMDTRKNLYHFGRVSSVLTFQHEVAHRMIAPPHDPERCRLSVICQNYAKVEYLFTLPGGAFIPHPDVDVGVVRLTPLRRPYICSSPGVPMPFNFVNKVITTLYHNKNKHIRTNLSKLFPKINRKFAWTMSETILDMTGLSFDRKPISLNLEEIEKICIAYHQLCQEHPDSLTHIDPEVQRAIDATERCLNMEDSNKLDELEDSPKYDIKF